MSTSSGSIAKLCRMDRAQRIAERTITVIRVQYYDAPGSFTGIRPLSFERTAPIQYCFLAQKRDRILYQ